MEATALLKIDREGLWAKICGISLARIDSSEKRRRVKTVMIDGVR